jgi:hypothetical protein
MREGFLTVVVGCILLFSVYSAWNDKANMIKHNEFFERMSGVADKVEQYERFMNAGRRNTADMGLKLCDRLNELEFQTDIELTDCEAIYGR